MLQQRFADGARSAFANTLGLGLANFGVGFWRVTTDFPTAPRCQAAAAVTNAQAAKLGHSRLSVQPRLPFDAACCLLLALLGMLPNRPS